MATVMATKMAKMAEPSGGGFTALPMSWWQRTRSFYTDVRMEMKKVTHPAFKEVRATTAVVIVAVFIFGVYFWLVDSALGLLIDRGLRYFSTR